mmetsp:Transcript_68603/g.143115  ORF Transcript_68603/g.143115 Transcript_68603/m.143115 type:complete len:1720 (-) Transcript_68603:7252-12411(-)
MKHVVNQAIQCGREFRDLDPTSDLYVKKNYIAVQLDIESFGAQIAKAAPKDRRDIFNQEDLMEFPLSPLLEWHALHRSFDPHLNKDPTAYREALNTTLAENLNLSQQWITTWVSRIANARTDLIKCESSKTVDTSIIGTVINKFVALDDTVPNSTKWQIKASKWQEKYLEDNTSISWMNLKQSILSVADASKPKRETATENASECSVRPRLQPATPSGVALAAAERDEIYNFAFNAALAAVHADRQNRVCYTCGKPGHIQRDCPLRAPGQQNNFYPPMQQRISRWDLRGRGRSQSAGSMTGRGEYPPYGRAMGPAGGQSSMGSAGGRGSVMGSAGGQSGVMGFSGGQGTVHAGRSQSAEPGFGGGRGAAPTFGRGIPSRSFHDAIGQNPSAMLAYPEMHQPHPAQFEDCTFEDMGAAYHTHTPGEQEPAYDRDLAFQQQVFGGGTNFGSSPSPSSPPLEWADPSADSPLDDEFIVRMNGITPPFLPTRPRLAQRVIPMLANAITFLPTVLALIATSLPVLRRGFSQLQAPRTQCATVGLILLVILLTSTLPSTIATNTTISRDSVYTTVGANSSTLDSYLLDSGCTTSIVADTRFLSDFKRISPVRVDGLAGNKTYNWKATLTIPLRTIHGQTHNLQVKDVFWDEGGYLNLISCHQVEQQYCIVLDGNESALYEREHVHHLVAQHHPVKLPVAKIGRLYLLPIHWRGADAPATPWQAALHATPTEYSFNCNCGTMSLEELMHLRIAHTPVPKLSVMSRLVSGLPRGLHFNKIIRFPCGHCQEAKAKRQPYPAASTSVSTRESDLMTWDSFDMGDKHPSLGGNRYVSVFVIHRSRFAITLLHKDRSFETMKGLLIRAFARAGFTPKRVRHDGAGEYISTEITEWLAQQGTFIWSEKSNPHEQFGNAISEKLVDTLGKGIRTLLLHSQLPPEFWGAAALYYTDVYNHIPHSSLDNQIPQEIHTGKQADVSWFRPFGCRATLFRGRDLVEHHKLAPRGEQGVFIGLGLTHGYKSWVIYCPRLNRIFVSRNVTYDETLFPLREHDQRTFGFYDQHAVHEMRADAYGSINPTTINEDVLNMPLPKPPTSTRFSLPAHNNTSPDVETLLSQASTVLPSDDESEDESSPVNTRSCGGNTTRSSGGVAAQSGGGVATRSSGGSPAPSAGSASAGELRHTKRPRFSEAPPAYGQRQSKWWNCEEDNISDVTDAQLAEYLIGHSININFPADFWPADRGHWAGEAFDTGTDPKNFRDQLFLRFLLTSGPRSRKFGEHAIIPISHVSDRRGTSCNKTIVSVRRALAEDFPYAVKCKDLTIDRAGKLTGNGKPKTKSRVTRSTSRLPGLPSNLAAKASPTQFTAASTIRHSPEKCIMPALYAFAATTMLHAQQHDYNYVSDIDFIEPKSERAARESDQCNEWITAEEIELKTVWKMGTFEIVDIPPGVVPLPSRFTYRIKRCRDGKIAKYKARLVARGDMQYECDFSETYAPTSRFAAIRTIISIATQENLTLKHWDISGAFMTADIDTEIYMDLPPGYHLGPGKTIKLLKSLYGLRQSPGLFHETLEDWLLNYGFKKVTDDCTIFKLTRNYETILLSLFVDDGLCAINSESLYQDFLADLRTKFELSYQGDLNWYLGVAIDHNRASGITTLSQELFIETLIRRFNMEGCNPVATPAEPNTHLLKADQPATPDKSIVRDYQRLVGGLMYLSFTRPDIAYAVNQCAKFMANP